MSTDGNFSTCSADRASAVLRRRRIADIVCIVFGTAVLAFVMRHNEFERPDTYMATVKVASDALRGELMYADLAQDYVGWRALREGSDPYPILGLAFRDIGIEWNVKHRSTHPPSAYLLLAPFAWQSWPAASAAWSWMMLVLLFLSLRFCGLRTAVAAGLTPLAILWPPVAHSLQQLTIVWLFGTMAAYASMRRWPSLGGAAIALASLTKLVPAIMLAMCVRRRAWRAFVSFASVWSAALLTIMLISPGAFARYADVGRTASEETIARPDNSAFLVVVLRLADWPGFACVMLFLAAIIIANIQLGLRFDVETAPLHIWMTGLYLSVALLPIAWIYSLTPLLPVILYLLQRRTRSGLVVGIGALAIPMFAPSFSYGSALPLAGTTFLVGVGLLLSAHPIRLPFADFFGELFQGHAAVRSDEPAA